MKFIEYFNNRRKSYHDFWILCEVLQQCNNHVKYLLLRRCSCIRCIHVTLHQFTNLRYHFTVNFTRFLFCDIPEPLYKIITYDYKWKIEKIFILNIKEPIV